MKYIVATPVGKQKLYAMKEFIDHLNNLNQLPETLLVSTTPDIFEKCMKFGECKFPVKHVHGSEDNADNMVSSITSAREELRKQSILWMTQHRALKVEWLLWLDNDILVFPDLIEVFESLLSKYPNLIMANSYHPARQDEVKVRHGISCTFTHRDALMGLPFMMACVRGAHLGDDQIWLNTMHHMKGIRGQSGEKLEVLGGIFFDVIHLTEDGKKKRFGEQENVVIVEENERNV